MPPEEGRRAGRRDRAELADTNRRIEAMRDKREQALLADDTTALDAIELTMSRLQRTAQRQQERLRLLQQAGRGRGAGRRQQAQASPTRALRQAAGGGRPGRSRIADTVAQVVTLYRKIIDIRETARAAWPISRSAHQCSRRRDRRRSFVGQRGKGAAELRVLSASAPIHFLAASLARGRQQSLPGAMSPRIDQQLNPAAIKPFADALKQASAFAVDAMENQARPVACTIGEAVAPSIASAATPNRRFAALLKQQAEAAADTSEAGERRVYGNRCRAHQTVERATTGA